MSLLAPLGQEGFEYLTMIHQLLFSLDPSGAGTLDTDNINGALTDTDTTDHAAFTGVTTYQHHGAGGHYALDQAAASVDATGGTASTVSVTAADADATYDAAEQGLLNELKADLNTLVTDVNAINTALDGVVTSVNDLKAKLRTAGVLAT